ncbi:MAG: ROK family protein, partial [Acidimicrobiales bacterium]
MTAPSPLVAGLDLGGTKILGVVTDPDEPRRSLCSVRVDTPRGADALVAAMAGVVADLRSELARRSLGDVAAVGVGVAGLVDRAGVLRFAPNLPGVVDLDVRGALGEATAVPVAVDNDANVATLAEHRLGAGERADDMVLVTLGTGIGGGIISGGVLQRGAAGFAG